MKNNLLFLFILILSICVSCTKESVPTNNTNNSGQNSGTGNGGQNPSEPDPGGQNPGGQNGNPLDFDFYVLFDTTEMWSIAFNNGYGKYDRDLGLGFGVNPWYHLFSQGITEFAVGIQCLDGSVYYKTGWQDNVYVTKEGRTIWYTGYLTSEYTTEWQTYVSFQNMSSATVNLKWTYRVKYNGTYYLEGDHWKTESYSGTPY